MANKMLIDAAHPEETRVAVVRGNRLEEFDFEAANRRPLRGNIFLAKVTRVEPSLQACFVDYGGNRHGFLAFSEIHPDYYQIPVADRQALIAEEERAARAAEADQEQREPRAKAKSAEPNEGISEEPALAVEDAATADDAVEPAAASAIDADGNASADDSGPAENGDGEAHDDHAEDEVIESVGAGDALEEIPERQPRRVRHYKIQEVIKRRQIMLVQVVKEERGTKGAAMTTYLSLAGRYSVLMPNTSRGGGISRKITDGADRKRLKELVQDLEMPEGMGVILRTAGASRTKTEIKRDFEYLLRLWETIRELTLKSSAPALVYEEGSLTKRAMRDLYNKDIDEILVAGDDGYKEAKEFMRMLMPSHAKNVKPYKDTQPLFTRYGVESQLDAMFSPTVQLKSGGYIVINPAEALVAIDVNSGRSTREHHIEDTALRTNLEAAEEIARQLRLRDLAGLIVIDFIDMEQKRNNRAVERKLKECLKSDRARIQVGRISHFGLLEMSRQRIRSGVLESSTVPCPHCGGTGYVRSVSSVSLHLLRSLEEQLLKSATHDLAVRAKPDVALYVLNQKRAHLRELEQRFGVNILIGADATLAGQQYFVVEKGPSARGTPIAVPHRIAPDTIMPAQSEEEAEEITAEESAPEPGVAEDGGEPARRRKRRRRRGRGRGREGQEHAPLAHDAGVEQPVEHDEDDEEQPDEAASAADAEIGTSAETETETETETEAQRRRRRRGRRGGRRNRRGRERPGEQAASESGPHEETSDDLFSEDTFPDEPGEELPEPAASDPFRSITEPQPEPSFATEAEAHSPAEPSEPPASSHGSTVREPVPIIQFDDAVPMSPRSHERPAEPAPANDQGSHREDSEPMPERPRRTGWWQRR